MCYCKTIANLWDPVLKPELSREKFEACPLDRKPIIKFKPQTSMFKVYSSSMTLLMRANMSSTVPKPST